MYEEEAEGFELEIDVVVSRLGRGVLGRDSQRSDVFIISLIFFFQAEDGIRDHCVTGVQTCALPI